MLGRLKYTVSQAFKQIGRNKAMSFASVFAITAMLLILGMFFVIIINVNTATESIKNDYDSIEVFLEDSVTTSGIMDMKDQIASWDNVEKVDYVPKAQAMKTLKARWGDKGYLLDSLKTNPLPNSLIVKVKDLNAAEDTVTAVSALKGVEDVNYYKDTVDKLLKVTHGLQTAALVIMGFLIIVSIVVVSNTIKLTVFNRAEEISIMKYVGATNWFIRGPFLAEGIIIGCFSALVSAGIVALIYGRVAAAIGDKMLSMMSVPLVPVGFLSYNLVWIFLALGISIGAWGSIISMRRFLDT
ncbi:MAG: permease-like cell division protein FtsX [Eubacteriaceae bacterium]|jgi:cell division transport system permease protein|nr:permease-like cell division protein FtsX [Eubacteriaceae bacterium]